MKSLTTAILRRALILLALCLATCSAVAQDANPPPEKTADPAKPKQPLAARCLAFSPDGRSLAAAYGNNTGPGRLIVWDLAQKKPRFGHNEIVVVTSLAYSPAGDRLAVGALVPVVRLLDPNNGRVLRMWKAHDNHVRSVEFDATGTLATASYDKTIKLWDPVTGTLHRTLTGPKAPLRVIDISPDGRRLACAGGEEHNVRLWDLAAPEKDPREFKLDGFVPQVAFSPDSRTLAVSSWVDGCVLFDVLAGQERERLRDVGGVHWTAYSPDGRWLAVASNAKDVYLFAAQQTPSEAQRIEIAGLIEQFNDDDYAQREAASRRLGELGGVALTQIRAQLESPSAEMRIRCRRLVEQAQSGTHARKLTGHTDELDCLAFSADGSQLASGDAQGVVKLWDVATWKNTATLKPPNP